MNGRPAHESVGDVVHIEDFCLAVEASPVNPVDRHAGRVVVVFAYLDAVTTSPRVSQLRIDKLDFGDPVSDNPLRAERQRCMVMTVRL